MGKRGAWKGRTRLLLFSHGPLLKHHIKELLQKKGKEPYFLYCSLTTSKLWPNLHNWMSGRKLLCRKMLLHSETRRKPCGLQQLLLPSSIYAAIAVTGLSLQSLFLHTINQQELASSFSLGYPVITCFHFSVAQLYSCLCFTARCLSNLMKIANITLYVHHHNDNINKNYSRHRSKLYLPI